MQYMVYRNKGNSKAILIYLMCKAILLMNCILHGYPIASCEQIGNNPASALTPTLNVEGNDHLVMTSRNGEYQVFVDW